MNPPAKAKTATKDHPTGATTVGGAPEGEQPEAQALTQQQAIDQAYLTLCAIFRQGPFQSDMMIQVKNTLDGIKPYTTQTGPY